MPLPRAHGPHGEHHHLRSRPQPLPDHRAHPRRYRCRSRDPEQDRTGTRGHHLHFRHATELPGLRRRHWLRHAPQGIGGSPQDPGPVHRRIPEALHEGLPFLRAPAAGDLPQCERHYKFQHGLHDPVRSGGEPRRFYGLVLGIRKDGYDPVLLGCLDQPAGLFQRSAQHGRHDPLRLRERRLQCGQCRGTHEMHRDHLQLLLLRGRRRLHDPGTELHEAGLHGGGPERHASRREPRSRREGTGIEEHHDRRARHGHRGERVASHSKGGDHGRGHRTHPDPRHLHPDAARGKGPGSHLGDVHLAHGVGRDRRDHPRDRDRLRLRGLRVREAERPGLRGHHEHA